VSIPFEPGFIDQGWAADGNFADVVWEGAFCSNGAEECIPT
jgi:hypothetical protein